MNKKNLITISISILIATLLFGINYINQDEEFVFNPVTQTILGVKNDKYVKTLTIPSEINGVKVKNIQISNGELPNLEKVIIESGIEEIGEECFFNSSKLISITIPKTVKKINNKAFSKCDQLINITIPNSVEYIGEGAFSECLKLENVAISKNLKTVANKAFWGTKWMRQLLENEENINNELYIKIIESNDNK